jgi:hypothetical protein
MIMSIGFISLLSSLINAMLLYYGEGPGSSVGIATDHGQDGPGIESR